MGALSNSDRTDLRAGHHQPPMPPAGAAAPTHLSQSPVEWQDSLWLPD
ncbi:hypothetical protein Nmel_005282 [Mimus melanotis]